ncbi:hypothetical protein [Agrobacterium sp. LMR679]|uniref:hypothetical protein n=1 Tax=Agrobacterium sp. LMR679 TaxID=3014335 RepID=UPI0022AF4510|nr:hypothetical protein [Agrobacterium sp. LMR679]MCZ4073542.1 hypothetical protein [Agrobacterium sp. LMR679]MCZ4076235.1 hypothetical protein [Agrobacterium sp. LMR679]MCZ4076302.1 hypothetical protein [Agrobacterium sp. LMR679]
MELAASFVTSIFGGGGAAAAGAATGAVTTGVAAPAATGFSLSSLLQGTATVLGMVQSINAGNADAEALNAAADDAAREVPLETLQGITRRTALKKEAMDSIAQQDVAYAASGVDLSFGTPMQARKDAFRQLDLGITSDVGTEQTRIGRLQEREAEYRKRASRAKRSAMFDAAMIGFKGATSIADGY